MRQQWLYKYPVCDLLNAAKRKHEHHVSRLKWWMEKRQEVFNAIRSDDGLQISESLVAQYAKTGYLSSGPEVTINPELKKQLGECTDKISIHKNLVDDYAGYVDLLNSRPPQEQFDLQIDDWKFFFGS